MFSLLTGAIPALMLIEQQCQPDAQRFPARKVTAMKHKTAALLCAFSITASSLAFAAGAHTPKPGSAERKAILDAMRAVVKRMSGLDVVFVVPYLKVDQGWAWIHTVPQSRDGRGNYEDVSMLLHKKQGKWKPAGIAAACEPGVDDTPDCSEKTFIKRLKAAYPSAPLSIFPPQMLHAQ